MEQECIPYYEDADRLTVQAISPIVGKRFITAAENFLSGPGIPATAQVGASDPTDGGNIMAAHCPAGAKPLGGSSWTAGIGAKLGCITEGVVPITAGANLAAGQSVAVGAEGKAVAMAAEGTAASFTSGEVAKNNAIKYTSVSAGAKAGLKIVLKVAGANTPLSVKVAGEVVTVEVGTDAESKASSTANEVIAAINATPAATALLTAANGGASTGVGKVEALAEKVLTGGISPTELAGLCLNGVTSGEDAMIKLVC